MTEAVYDDLEDDSDFDSGNGSEELDFDSEFSDTLPPPWWRMPTSAVDDDNEDFDEDDG